MFFMLFEKKTKTCVALILFTRAQKHNGLPLRQSESDKKTMPKSSRMLLQRDLS
jgi:hypothetical protein